MPLSFEVAADERVARVSGRGPASFDDLVRVMHAVVADPAFGPDVDVLADFRELDYTPSLREIRQLGGHFESVRAVMPPRVGIVVKDRVQLRLGRFAALVAGLLRFDLAVFDDAREAEAWLDRRRQTRLDDVKARILQIWSQPQLTALATVTREGKPWVRYVLTTADEDLNVRFVTDSKTRKVEQIAANPEVHLVAGVSHPTDFGRWVQLSGRAEMSLAAEDRRLAWRDELGAYFDGQNDPRFVVGIVRPYRIEYMEMGFVHPEIWTG
jgi:general stress protein 26